MTAGSLWRDGAFVKLWTGTTLAAFGFHVSVLALQLTAALVLHAGAMEMGILAAVQFAPALVFTLLAGVWVDRGSRRRLMITADLGRALILGIVPLGALAGWLSLELLYVVAFATGALTSLFDVAFPSYLPTLVSRARVTEANTALQGSAAVANIVGPNAAGGLVQLLGAPLAIVGNIVSLLVSALLLSLIRRPEPPVSKDQDQSGTEAIVAGLRTLWQHLVLAAMTKSSMIYGFFTGVRTALVVVFLTTVVHASPTELGIVFGAGGAGALLGALAAGRVASSMGLGPSLIGVYLGVGAFAAILPLAALMPGALAVGAAALAQFGFSFGGAVWGVNGVALWQSAVPGRLLGRLTASNRFLRLGATPVGALIGGGLGELVGLGPSLLLASAGLAASCAPLLFSPVKQLRTLPPHALL
ncbi:MFS transporter [Kribbella sp. CA-293567]|uniref:MFS transporter n=1 Tax=Kribbella sp. CA-293567 TaxID=3002436 RepID=UPI0022DD66D3|nr:MFS transporter [Kribbella sp. CA-293567]WBQ03896.1 MFS transporter [Kribbella sp. CA-293567]